MRLLFLLLIFPYFLLGQSYVFRGDAPLYQEFVDYDFTFLEATLDLRGIAPAGNTDNLVPRGIFMPLAEDVFVCFDTELLRIAGIWRGNFTTLEGVAIKSYGNPFNKKNPGQKVLPEPIGAVVASIGLYPGWHKKGGIFFRDPRQRWLNEKELGRGPLPPEYGEWLGIEDLGDTAVLNYTLFGGSVKENYRLETVDNQQVVVRSIRLEGVNEPVTLIVNDLGEGTADRYTLKQLDGSKGIVETAIVYPVKEGQSQSLKAPVFDFSSQIKETTHWPDRIKTNFEMGEAQGSYTVDQLTIPYPNPWERRIRPFGIDFFEDGTAAVVTYDGDVYLISDLGTVGGEAEWTKIAAGFNEPCSIRIRDGQIFVFSRLGITQLVDRNGDGETDFYKMFCNRFLQSAEPRDFPHSLVPWEKGQWIISKGGQQSDYPTPHSGRALLISADGKEVDYWAYGMRNGYLNSIPERKLLIASDQQGKWVPTTPFHIVNKDSFLGFEPAGPYVSKEVQPPALWLPHRVSPSPIDPLWGGDPRLGALYKSVLFIDHTRPGITKIFIPDESPITQTAGVPIDLKISMPLLKGAINPVDGMVYMTGFQIWDGPPIDRLEGLSRLRVVKPTDEYPIRAKLFDEGLLLKFSEKLDAKKALDPANYQVSTWNYLRQSKYGSAQYKADGAPGVDSRFIHSVLLSEDEKSIFVAIDEMTTSMQLELQFNLFDDWKGVYFTANELPPVSLSTFGFRSVHFSKLFSTPPTPRDTSAKNTIVSESRGQDLVKFYGCVACHSIDGSTEGKSGPTWKGLWKARRMLPDGSRIRATEEYLRDSIYEPEKVFQLGYQDEEAGMPSYKGILSEADVDSIILYISSLHR